MRKVALLVLVVAALAVMPVAAARSGSASIILTGLVEYNFQVYSDWAKTTLLDLTKAEDLLKVDGIGFTTNYPGTWYAYVKSTGRSSLYGTTDIYGWLLKNGIVTPVPLYTAQKYTATLGGNTVNFTNSLSGGGAGVVSLTHTGPVSDWVLDFKVSHLKSELTLEEGTYTDTVVVTMTLD
jgi:hypothetical protein